MIDTGMLIGGIILLVIAIILYAIRTYIPPAIATIGAVVAGVIGVVLIILSVLLPYI